MPIIVHRQTISQFSQFIVGEQYSVISWGEIILLQKRKNKRTVRLKKLQNKF